MNADYIAAVRADSLVGTNGKSVLAAATDEFLWAIVQSAKSAKRAVALARNWHRADKKRANANRGSFADLAAAIMRQ